jgi:hypothetical protein
VVTRRAGLAPTSRAGTPAAPRHQTRCGTRVDPWSGELPARTTVVSVTTTSGTVPTARAEFAADVFPTTP